MKDKHVKYLMVAPLLILLAGLIFYPLLHLFSMASEGGLAANVMRLINDTYFWRTLRVTFLFVIGSVFLQLILGMGLALLVSDLENTWVRAILLLPMMVAPAAVGLVWRIMLQPMFGIANVALAWLGLPVLGWLADPKLALPSIILVDVWQWTCFMYLILLAGLKSIPRDCYEAAVIDGANSWTVFQRITLPLLKPTIYVAVLFRSIDAFKALDKFVTLTDGGPGQATEVLALRIYKVSFVFMDLNYGAFLALAAVVIVLLYNLTYTRLMGTARTT